MKKIILLLFIVTISVSQTTAQQTKFNFSLMRKMNNPQARIADKEIALFVKGDVNEIKQRTVALGGVFKYSAGDISAIRIPLSKVNDLASLNSVVRIEDNDLKLQTLNDRMVINNHVIEVQNGFNLPQGYDGTGVVMGIIDEGIDWTHPDFRNLDGTTRIKFLWDQSIVNYDTATEAQPYGYGKQYIGFQIDTSTQHYDPQGHGTHVSGIACGNGNTLNNYKGVAPKADMVIVKMNLNQNDNDFLSSLVDAVKYIYDRADELHEPAVINVSLGTYYGSHDGKDIQTRAIENIITAQTGRALVAAGGNLGNGTIHLGYDVGSDTSFTWMQYSNNGYIFLDLWGDSADFENIQFAVGIDRTSPDYNYRGGLPFSNVFAHIGMDVTDTIYAGGNRMGTIESFGQYLNGAYNMEYLIRPDSVLNVVGVDTMQYLWRLMTKGSGHFDGWCYDLQADNLPDSSVFPFITKYKRPDFDQTMVGAFQCSDKVITVGSYTNRDHYTNVNYQTVNPPAGITLIPGALSVFSSHGPTRDGRIKPDITATGEWVLSCGVQSLLTLLAASEPDKVAAGGKHFRSSGTSMASPSVAGIVALYLQRYPTASLTDIKQALYSCVTTDAFTGTNLPNNMWGVGKANAYNMVKGCLIGIDEEQLNPVYLNAYPNPSSENISVTFDLSSIKNFRKATLQITDALGREVKNIVIRNSTNKILLTRNELGNGVFFCSMIVDGNTKATKRIVIL